MRIDDSRPIWVQLVETFRKNIASGQWAPGSKIPSVRELAIDAGVNPNTVQRALAELDRDGLTIPERTQGRFVTSDATVIHTIRHDLAQGATDDHITTLKAIGMDIDEATALLLKRWPHASSHGAPQ
ncbi:GntR family transcriptional regulator [Schaalia suimastitidis]|uniref:GntR family transcriptional regulator n=1 Tax=Schaalia suimastitidis TaxID=121163 RepID=UPI000410A351|nr:GntR family transcriptional regulator [Schaalia suimastitidis]